MPRKKLETPSDVVPTAETIEKKPARTRRAKQPQVPVEAAEPAAEVQAVEPVVETKPKRKRSPKVVVVPEVVAETVEVVEESQPQPESVEVVVAPKPRRTRTPKAAKVAVEEPAPEPQVEQTPVVEAPAKPRPSRRRKPAKQTVVALAPETPEVNEPGWDEDLPIPFFRPLTVHTAVAEEAEEEVAAEPADAVLEAEETESVTEGDAPQRKRRRRRRKSGPKPDEVQAQEQATPVEESPEPEPEAEIAPIAPKPTQKPRNEHRQRPAAAPAPMAVEPSAKEEPRVEIRAPRRPPVEIPSDAPQVILRDGVPTLVRNHRVYPPLFFFGSPDSEKRALTVIEELQMAAEAGVHLHSFYVDFEVHPDAVAGTVAVASYILSKAVEVDKDAQVLFRLSFQAPRNWPEQYPNSRYRSPHGDASQPSISDDDYWAVASKCLESFVQQMRLLDMRDHILGVHLEHGEWFAPNGAGYDISQAAKAKFRDWTRMRYLNDEVTLRASWFDGQVRFDNILIPDYKPEGFEGERFVRSSRKQRKYVDYHLFLSDATVSRIAELAYTVKKASGGYFLVGASYGYTFEWSHPASGHLSLGKLLRTPEIDFIAGPPSYKTREPGGTAPFPCPVDSFALNGKLFLSEEDFKTSLSQGHEPDDFNPPLRTPQALDSVHWRGVGAALAHSSGVQWMDLWGNGWLRSHSIWERAKKVLDELTVRLGTPCATPEVAVFIDERALAYLVDENAFTLLVQNVREAVLRSGVNAAFYLLSDLQHREVFPESKLYLFLNAWDVRPELRASIKSRLQKDGKVLFWLYSAGLFDAGRDSLERAREVTGVALKPQPFYSKSGTTITDRRHPLAMAFPDRTLASGTKLEPSYFAIPEEATKLGEYTQTGLPSFVVKEHREGPQSEWWTSVFLGEPQVNPALIRALAQMAGAHVYNFHGDVTHVRPPFLTVHCTGTGPRTITLPSNCCAFNVQTRQWAAVDTTNLRFNALDGSTHVFLVGTREELEHILNKDPKEILKIEQLPDREANVLGDLQNFDVPIMKLDEWIESGDSDDVADEWFLRAPQITEEIEPATEDLDRPGRRRRRRRGGRPNDGSPSAQVEAGSTQFAAADVDPDGFGMNIVFRKRD